MIILVPKMKFVGFLAERLAFRIKKKKKYGGTVISVVA